MYAVVGPGIVFCDTLYALIILIVFPPFPISFCQDYLHMESEPESTTRPHHLPRVERSAPPGKYLSFAVGIVLHTVVVLEDLNFFM